MTYRSVEPTPDSPVRAAMVPADEVYKAAGPVTEESTPESAKGKADAKVKDDSKADAKNDEK